MGGAASLCVDVLLRGPEIASRHERWGLRGGAEDEYSMVPLQAETGPKVVRRVRRRLYDRALVGCCTHSSAPAKWQVSAPNP